MTWSTWLAAALLPLLVEAVQRAAGRADRAQEEVGVVERMGERLLQHGTPYLSRDVIAALPVDDRLSAYSPYQPGMAVFGLPRAFFGNVWWTDARVWFAAVTAAALIATTLLLRPQRPAAPIAGHPLVRAVQAATVLPICALTLATGGDDLPVLALCLLALALAAVGRFGSAGVAVGAAAAAKLFALPVAAVLIVLAFAVDRARRRGRADAHAVGDARAHPAVDGRPARLLLIGAVGLPVLVLLPSLVVAADAITENLLRFPLGHGLVTSPAQSPFPGYLIAQHLPGGRLVTLGLLLAAAAAVAVRLIRRPPHTAAAAAHICGWGLLAAILLMPTTRFGYLLYPIALLLWAPSLHQMTPVARPIRSNACSTEPEPD